MHRWGHRLEKDGFDRRKVLTLKSQVYIDGGLWVEGGTYWTNISQLGNWDVHLHRQKTWQGLKNTIAQHGANSQDVGKKRSNLSIEDVSQNVSSHEIGEISTVIPQRKH